MSAPAASDPVSEFLAENGRDLLERLNEDFEDSVLLVARSFAGRPAATRATALAVDRHGLDVEIVEDGGAHRERVDFAAEVTDPTELTAALFGLVEQARELFDDVDETTAERELAELAAIRTFLTTVVRVEDVHPHLRRITFAGGDLETFAPNGPDAFCYVLLPPPGSDTLPVDQGFTWEQYGEMPAGEQPVGAYYTVRAWRPDVVELDMLFVLHGDGHASGWAARAQRGDPVALWGPRTSYHPPAETDWVLLVADETGLPAAAVILEQLPAGQPARVLAEVADASEHHPLPERAGTEVTWLHRDGGEAGTTTLLADAARALDWLPGRPYVWGGGESRAMTAVRRYVRDDRGLDRASVSLVAYWRHDPH